MDNGYAAGKGICLQERALIQFPNGVQRSASIWKHTQGVQSIYAIAPDEEGILTPYALEPVWKVRVDEDGDEVWQGMGSDTWPDLLSEWWSRVKLVFTKGRTRIRKLNLA
jgi:hypothetical protein